MNEKYLQHIGLTKEESKIYYIVLKNGILNARGISLKTEINRSLVYKVLKKLKEYNLIIEEENKSGIAIFRANHPSILKEFIINKENEIKLADNSYNEIIGDLIMQYNLTSSKPKVQFFEGIQGLKYLYKDILNSGQNIFLIRSPIDNKNVDTDKLIKEQIKKQVEKGIKTKCIVPSEFTYDDIIKERDKMNLVTRCRIPKSELNIPSQILIYDNKVALTSFTENMITTIIEDKSIVETYNCIFNKLWSTGEY